MFQGDVMGIHFSQVLAPKRDFVYPSGQTCNVAAKKWSDIENMVRDMQWNPSPQARIEIMRRARQHQRADTEVRHDALVAGMDLALARQHEAQPVRFGPQWVVDDDGQKMPVVPNNLAPDYYRRWLAQEAREAAEAHLRGLPYPTTRSDALDAMRSDTDKEALLFSLESQEDDWELDREESIFGRQEEDIQALTTLLEGLLPYQRELVSALERGEKWADVARRMGRTSAAVRKDAQRTMEDLRKKHGALVDAIEHERWGDEPTTEERQAWKEADDRAWAHATEAWDNECARDPEFETHQQTIWLRANRKTQVVLDLTRQLALRNEGLKAGLAAQARQAQEEVEQCRKNIRDTVREEWTQRWFWEHGDDEMLA